MADKGFQDQGLRRLTDTKATLSPSVPMVLPMAREGDLVGAASQARYFAGLSTFSSGSGSSANFIVSARREDPAQQIPLTAPRAGIVIEQWRYTVLITSNSYAPTQGEGSSVRLIEETPLAAANTTNPVVLATGGLQGVTGASSQNNLNLRFTLSGALEPLQTGHAFWPVQGDFVRSGSAFSANCEQPIYLKPGRSIGFQYDSVVPVGLENDFVYSFCAVIRECEEIPDGRVGFPRS